LPESTATPLPELDLTATQLASVTATATPTEVGTAFLPFTGFDGQMFTPTAVVALDIAAMDTPSPAEPALKPVDPGAAQLPTQDPNAILVGLSNPQMGWFSMWFPLVCMGSWLLVIIPLFFQVLALFRKEKRDQYD
jgi:hypothetical protein